MFDLAALKHAVALHNVVARVVIAGFEGSSPREVGAAMLVWHNGQSGSIGGGALEWQATLQAHKMLAEAASAPVGPLLDHQALGPALGQCCGGVLHLLTEIYRAADTQRLDKVVIARSLTGTPMPLAVARLLDLARGQGVLPVSAIIQGWMIEPVARPKRQLWIWGAGHVGRALVDVMAPLPGVTITWVDVSANRFPDNIPVNVQVLPVTDPALAVALAPPDAEHIVLTFSHALDLELCHRLLGHGFSTAGLIGSATKWARFKSRLANLGHSAIDIARITCPIGDPGLGKHPHTIAIGVAGAFLAARGQVAKQESVK